MRKTSLALVHELARRDPRVVYVGSDLGIGTLDAMREEMPERFFMEGVSEANIIGLAAGLALDGFIPYVNTIATFLTRRCYEQIAVDLCLHKLPVRLIANGGGLVYAPLGPTHMAVEDIALMRALPDMAVIAPSDAEEMRRAMSASLDWPTPIYIRLGKGGDPVVSRADDGFAIGQGIALRAPGEVTILSTGIMVARALDAAERLTAQGIPTGVINLHTVKPLDEETVRDAAERARLLVTLEEHSLIGGLGSAVAELLIDTDLAAQPRLLRLGLPDRFSSDYGSQDSLLQGFGLQPPEVAERIAAVLSRIRVAA